MTNNSPRVAFVGGMDRNERALLDAGREEGVAVEVHVGDVRGRGAEALAGIIRRADLVVLVTGVNSHGGAQIAKKLARAANVPMIIAQSCGVAVARQILRDVARGEGALAGRKLARVA